MKSDKPPPKIEDVDLRPDAWDRFVDAIKRVAQHEPIEHPTRHGKGKPKRKPRVSRRP